MRQKDCGGEPLVSAVLTSQAMSELTFADGFFRCTGNRLPAVEGFEPSILLRMHVHCQDD